MKNQPKPKPVMTVKKVTKKVTGPMPKTRAADPAKRTTNVRTQENVARKNQGSLKK